MKGREIFIFISGVALGMFTGYKAAQSNYEYYEECNAVEACEEEPDGEQQTKETEKKDYVKLAKKYNKDYSSPKEAVDELLPEEEDDITKGETESEEYANRGDDIYKISDDEFADSNVNHDKVTLYYYTVDDTLTDDSEEFIDDRRMLGDVDLSMWEDPSTMYVRNEAIGIDYEIILIHGTYSEINGD